MFAGINILKAFQYRLLCALRFIVPTTNVETLLQRKVVFSDQRDYECLANC